MTCTWCPSRLACEEYGCYDNRKPDRFLYASLAQSGDFQMKPLSDPEGELWERLEDTEKRVLERSLPEPRSDQAPICSCCGTPTAIDSTEDCLCTKCGWEFTTVVRSGDELKSNPFVAGTSSWEAYEAGWRDATNAAPDDYKEAADIIDLLKTVIETELVQLGLPTTATPTSGLGRARAFIQKHGPSVSNGMRATTQQEK